MKERRYTIFTDGSSRGNPGPGGWAAVIVGHEGEAPSVIELGGAERETTNNRMELVAASRALSRIPAGSSAVVHTDSSYLINGATRWVKGWKRNGWKTQAKGEVLNRDLWEELHELAEARRVSWEYVGGHVGIVGNERCDRIATDLADGVKVPLYEGPLAGYDLPNILDISHDATLARAKKKAGTKAKAYSYVSMVGGTIEIHTTWPECEARVKGAKGAKYKKSVSADDEAQIVREWGTFTI